MEAGEAVEKIGKIQKQWKQGKQWKKMEKSDSQSCRGLRPAAKNRNQMIMQKCSFWGRNIFFMNRNNGLCNYNDDGMHTEHTALNLILIDFNSEGDLTVEGS